MTLIQKIIKYSAIAFGVFIIVSVCLGIINIFNIPKDISKNELKTIELLDGNVNELKLDLEGMNLIVETGETLSVSFDYSGYSARNALVIEVTAYGYGSLSTTKQYKISFYSGTY